VKTVELPSCFICGTPLRMALTRNRRGKVAVTLFCGVDGRHLRAFVNHRPWVEQVLAGAEAAGLGAPALGKAPQPAPPGRTEGNGRS
jgi:hypothetical protein